MPKIKINWKNWTEAEVVYIFIAALIAICLICLLAIPAEGASFTTEKALDPRPPCTMDQEPVGRFSTEHVRPWQVLDVYQLMDDVGGTVHSLIKCWSDEEQSWAYEAVLELPGG